MTKLGLSLFLALLLAAASAVLFYPPARAQQTDHAKQIGSRLMCMCGCNQILTQCNHVGCRVSASMLKQLDQAVARREADDLIVQAFVQEYGMMVFAEPPKKGFSRVAWFIPGVSLLAGAILVVFVISRWRGRPGAAALRSVAGTNAPLEWLEQGRQRADRETED